jgi:thiopeptide-type bacteriocin precursor
MMNTTIDAEFNLADLDLTDLTVVSMHDSAALPESAASYKSSSTCIIVAD